MYHLKRNQYCNICKLTGDMCKVLLHGASFSVCALPSVSSTGVKDYDAKEFLRMNTCSVREYIMLVPAEILRSWWQRQPSKQAILTRVSYGKLGSHLQRENTIRFPSCSVIHYCCLDCLLDGAPCTRKIEVTDTIIIIRL